VIQLLNIPTKSVDQSWGIVKSDIADALARSNGYALADHIKEWIKEEKMQLWILWDPEAEKEKYYGVVVTEIIQRPLQRCLNIKIMTGKHREQCYEYLLQILLLITHHDHYIKVRSSKHLLILHLCNKL